jgi:hypothetical protein
MDIFHHHFLRLFVAKYLITSIIFIGLKEYCDKLSNMRQIDNFIIFKLTKGQAQEIEGRQQLLIPSGRQALTHL